MNLFSLVKTRFTDNRIDTATALGVVVVVWFSALARGAYDLWAATLLFTLISLLAVLFLIARTCRPKPLLFPLALPLASLLLFFGLSMLHSADRNSTFLEIWNWIFLIGTFYLFVNATQRPERTRVWLSLMGGIVLPLTAVAVAQQFTGHPTEISTLQFPWPGGAFTLSYGHWEINSTLVNSIVFSGFVLPWTIFFWERARTERRYAVMSGLGLLSLLLARSTTSFAALLLGLAILYGIEGLRDRLRHSPLFRVAVLLLLLISAGLVSFKFLQPTFAHLYNATDRFHYTVTSLRMWRISPWTGVGLGSFATAYPYFKSGAAESTRLAHSVFLQILSESGVGGFLSFLLLIAVAFVQRGRERVYTAALAAILFHSAFNFHLEFFSNRLVFLIFLAASLKSQSFEKLTVTPRPLWTLTTGAAIVLLAPFWLRLYAASRQLMVGLNFSAQGQIPQARFHFENAITIDPSNADAWAALAALDWKRFQVEKERERGVAACRALQEAIRQRRDIRWVKRYEDYVRILSASGPPPP